MKNTKKQAGTCFLHPWLLRRGNQKHEVFMIMMKCEVTKIFGKKIGNCHVKKLGGHTCFSDTLRSLDSPERVGGGLQSRFAAPIQSSVYTYRFTPFYKTICQCTLLDMLIFIKEMILKVMLTYVSQLHDHPPPIERQRRG